MAGKRLRTIKLHKKCYILLVLFFLTINIYLSAEYPEIKKLDNSDLFFKQLQEDILIYYRLKANGDEIPPLQLYKYRTKSELSIFSLAARLNLPYEAIATLNRVDKAGTLPPVTEVLFPNMPGLFVPEKPESELEYILISRKNLTEKETINVIIRKKNRGERFLFFPGERFNSVELAYFLNILFMFPSEKGRISSSFGYRANPFSGKKHFHRGIDIAAPRGAKVLAARSGTITGIGYDDTYGNYVIISHDGEYETVYAHLEERVVELNQRVLSGMIIGKVGSTGLATGPHLHFEVRRKGEIKNPLLLLSEEYR